MRANPTVVRPAGAGSDWEGPAFGTVVRTLVRRPLGPAVGLALGLAVAAGWVQWAPERWAARALVAPALSGDTASAGRAVEAGAGPWLPGGSAVPVPAPAFERYLALLASPDLVARMAKQADGRTALDALDDPPLAGLSSRVGRLLGAGPTPAPTAAGLAERLSRRLEIRRAAGGTMHDLRIAAATPEAAERLLVALHESADAMVREAAGRRASSQGDYLTRQLDHVLDQDHRRVLAALLGRVERVRMMTGDDLPYAAEFVRAPVAEPRPAAPVAPLVLAACAGLGLSLGAGWALARSGR